MLVERQAGETLTALEMMHGDRLDFQLLSGGTVPIELVDTGADILHTDLEEPGEEQHAATTVYQFWADLQIGEKNVRLERVVGTQDSFYEPWVINGVRIWLDAVDAIFEFMRETHGRCRLQKNCSHSLPPYRHARLAVQDATARICPENLHAWCPLPPEGLKIEDCYRGEDCWMGAYDGASAHGGLDINQPEGTPLYAPIGLDDQFLYNSTERGNNNNRWRAFATGVTIQCGY